MKKHSGLEKAQTKSFCLFTCSDQQGDVMMKKRKEKAAVTFSWSRIIQCRECQRLGHNLVQVCKDVI